MAKKLSSNSCTTKRATYFRITKMDGEGTGKYVSNWEKAIKRLMTDFCFLDWQIEEAIEKAKAVFTPTDTETDKYNKAWRFFREEMMLSV